MKLPLLSGKQVLAALRRLGFVELHRKGSHVKMRHPDRRVIVFPYHDEVDRFTLKGALRDADVDLNEFLANYSLKSDQVDHFCGSLRSSLWNSTKPDVWR